MGGARLRLWRGPPDVRGMVSKPLTAVRDQLSAISKDKKSDN
jgi:hypothetical protein